MKKILFVVAAVVACSFASCGDKTVGQEGCPADSLDSVAVDSNEVVDTLDVDTF